MTKLIHNVLFNFSSDITPEEIKDCFNSLNDLKNSIAEIKSVQFKTNNSKEGLHKGFTHLVKMEFADEIALNKYLQHEAHVKLVNDLTAKKIIDLNTSILVFDYME